MLREDAPAHHYRAPINPVFVRQVAERRKRAEEAILAEHRAELERARREAVEAERSARAERLEQLEAVVVSAEKEMRRALKAIYDLAEGDYGISLTVKRSARLIIQEAAVETGIPYTAIVGPSRRKQIVEARFAAVRAVADERTDMSLPQIARAFKRDHTTIINALRKTKQEGQPR